MLYVHPDFQRQGVASALIGKADEIACNKRIQHLFTEASITARPVFEKHGFVVIEQQTVERNGQLFTNFKMQKHLKRTE